MPAPARAALRTGALVTNITGRIRPNTKPSRDNLPFANTTFSYCHFPLLRLAAKVAVENVRDERHAVVFHELHVLLESAIERHADFPWPREHFGILDRRLVRDVVRIDPSVALHHVQLIAVEISRSIEPGFVIEIGHIDNQCLAVPMAAGPTHPEI